MLNLSPFPPAAVRQTVVEGQAVEGQGTRDSSGMTLAPYHLSPSAASVLPATSITSLLPHLPPAASVLLPQPLPLAQGTMHIVPPAPARSTVVVIAALFWG